MCYSQSFGITKKKTQIIPLVANPSIISIGIGAGNSATYELIIVTMGPTTFAPEKARVVNIEGKIVVAVVKPKFPQIPSPILVVKILAKT
jgi:hypothetical protein